MFVVFFSFIIVVMWITNAGIFMSIEKTLLQFNVFTLMDFDLYKMLTNVK